MIGYIGCLVLAVILAVCLVLLNKKQTLDNSEKETLLSDIDKLQQERQELESQIKENQAEIAEGAAAATQRLVEMRYNIDQSAAAYLEVIKSKQEQQEQLYLQRNVSLEKEYEQKQQKLSNEYSQRVIILERDFTEKQEEFNKKNNELLVSFEENLGKLEQVKAALTAITVAEQRARQEENEKEAFNEAHSINLDADALNDISILREMQSSFKNPLLLKKLIWSEYCQKQVSSLAAKLTDGQVQCGIYKITDLLTGENYIGQSVNIGDRIKAHCKNGCGVGGTTLNKLYTTMLRDGIWNFTFEILELCSKEELNEKEKFWIDTYQSNKLGLNSTAGGS